MEDIRLGRKMYTRARNILQTGATIQVLDSDPARVAVIFGTGSIDGITIFPSAAFSGNGGFWVGGPNFNTLEFHVQNHGQVVNGPWFANGVGGAFLGIIEVFLKAESEV